MSVNAIIKIEGQNEKGLYIKDNGHPEAILSCIKNQNITNLEDLIDDNSYIVELDPMKSEYDYNEDYVYIIKPTWSVQVID